MQTQVFLIQNSVITLESSDLKNVIAMLRQFVAKLGATPEIPLPDSQNAGNLDNFLVDAPHEYVKTEETQKVKTDGHMDINKVIEKSVVICSVKV